MPGISLAHMIFLGAILLLFVGPSRLPQLGSSIGKAIRGFKDGINEIEGQASNVNPSQPEQLSQNHEDQNPKV